MAALNKEYIMKVGDNVYTWSYGFYISPSLNFDRFTILQINSDSDMYILKSKYGHFIAVNKEDLFYSRNAAIDEYIDKLKMMKGDEYYEKI